MKTNDLDKSIIKKMADLQKGDIPEHLQMRWAARTGEEFNPNTYFSILTHLTLKPGYTLDYLYDYDRHYGGSPWLYARRTNRKPFSSYSEINKWRKRTSLLSFLITDGSADGFFQLSVLQKLGEQFYLFWHACYNDTVILTSSADLEEQIDYIMEGRFGASLSPEQITAMRHIPLKPEVEINTFSTDMTLTTFSNWGGLERARTTYRKKTPHLQEGTKILYRVKYNCEIVF
ncbi:MAG: hypothetical protein AB1585_19045 [Thermodesulfobacteriota bacterium]